MVEQARQEAERIIETAHAERGSLISDTQVARQSQDEADRILAEARREAEEIRAEADDYVDSKLANFEVVLTKTIGSVDRGREKLLGRGPGAGRAGLRRRGRRPRVQRGPARRCIQRADEYVDAKLGAFEAVLSKTLDAVGRGRQKLHGRTASRRPRRAHGRPGRGGRPAARERRRLSWPGSRSLPSRSRQAQQSRPSSTSTSRRPTRSPRSRPSRIRTPRATRSRSYAGAAAGGVRRLSAGSVRRVPAAGLRPAAVRPAGPVRLPAAGAQTQRSSRSSSRAPPSTRPACSTPA